MSLLFCLFAGVAHADPSAKARSAKPTPTEKPAEKPAEKRDKTVTKLENYQDLIEKAQNLTLQRDRLQASQVLIRGINKETKNSLAYKELIKALDSLTTLFYTEKAHGLFSSAEAIVETKPKEASDTYIEALRLEDANLSLLKGLARAQLIMIDCGKADATATQAEGVNPFSPEVHLLRLQVLSCQKNFEQLATEINQSLGGLDPVERFVRGLEVMVAFHEAQQTPPPDLKAVRSLLATWESKDPDYPELYLWKWRYFQALATADDAQLIVKSAPLPATNARTSALRYTQLCQGLTQRKRKNLSLDVDLCRGVEEVEIFLKSSGQTQPTSTPRQDKK